MQTTDLNHTEQSCLLYIETCCVDHGGLLEGERMNDDDLKAVERFLQAGILECCGRIPSHLLTSVLHWHPTRYAVLTPAGWALAHTLRRQRAGERGPHATQVFEAVAERKAREQAA